MFTRALILGSIFALSGLTSLSHAADQATCLLNETETDANLVSRTILVGSIQVSPSQGTVTSIGDYNVLVTSMGKSMTIVLTHPASGLELSLNADQLRFSKQGPTRLELKRRTAEGGERLLLFSCSL